MENSDMKHTSARTRLLICGLVGAMVAFAIVTAGYWRYAPLGAWDSAALLYVVWVWLAVSSMNPADTKAMALREDPGRTVADILLIVASIASLIAVALLISEAGRVDNISKFVDISLALFSVVVSWSTVHTTFALKYARHYYGNPEGGINFNEQAPPRYSDFAYLAFTVGMTFQVSDTELQTKIIRRTVLHQALLSYIFGTVIIATTINIVVSLSQ